MAPKVKLGNSSFSLPRSRIARLVIGALFILGGIAGFLPVLGFWMVPVGLLVLSVDLPVVRRWRRRLVLWWEKRRRGDTTAGARRNDAGSASSRTGKEP